MFCFHFYRAPLLRDPPRHRLPDPRDADAWYPETWISYPLNQGPVPIHHADHFIAVAGLRAIMNEISHELFVRQGPFKKWTMPLVRRFYSQLQEWFAKLPEPLTISKIVQPFQLLLQYATPSLTVRD